MPECLKRLLAFVYQISPELLLPPFMAIIVYELMLTFCIDHDTQDRTLDETNCLYFDTDPLQDACFDAYNSNDYTVNCDQAPSFSQLAPICSRSDANDTIAACVDGLLSGVSDQQGSNCAHENIAAAHAKHADLVTIVAWLSTAACLMLGSAIYTRITGHYLGQLHLAVLKDRNTYTRLAERSLWLHRHPVVANMSLKTAAYLPVLISLPVILYAFQKLDTISTPAIDTVIRALNPNQTVCVFQPDNNATMINECQQDFLAGAILISVRYHEGNQTFPPITNEDRTYGYLYGANFAVGYLSHAEGMTHDHTIIPRLTALAWLLLSMSVCAIKFVLDNLTPLQKRADQYQYALSGTPASMWGQQPHAKGKNTKQKSEIASRLLPSDDLPLRSVATWTLEA